MRKMVIIVHGRRGPVELRGLWTLVGGIVDDTKLSGNAESKSAGSLPADLHLSEAESFQHARKRILGVLFRSFQYPILQGSVVQLTFGFDAHFAFQIRIGGREKARVSRIDSRLGIVNARAENFRCRNPQRNRDRKSTR